MYNTQQIVSLLTASKEGVGRYFLYENRPRIQERYSVKSPTA
jgi:hypothetical protein